jgi:hypothetical protein
LLFRSAANGLLKMPQQEHRQAIQDLLLFRFIQAIPYVWFTMEQRKAIERGTWLVHEQSPEAAGSEVHIFRS